MPTPKFTRFLTQGPSATLVLLLGLSSNASALDVGDRMPDCLLNPLNNSSSEVRLSQFNGGPLYVDFWASWCGPCAKSFPYMNQLESKHQASLKIIAVNLDEDTEDARAFLTRFPAQFTVARDADQACAQKFQVQAMPSSYLVDAEGIIRHIHLGFRSGETETLDKTIEALVAAAQ